MPTVPPVIVTEAPGAVVSVTVVPAVKPAAQLGAQLIPTGTLVTVPAAEPLTTTLSETTTGSAGVVAVASAE